jgi:hypothetical protein
LGFWICIFKITVSRWWEKNLMVGVMALNCDIVVLLELDY